MENTFQYNISPIYYSNLSLYCGIVTSPNVLNYTTVIIKEIIKTFHDFIQWLKKVFFVAHITILEKQLHITIVGA